MDDRRYALPDAPHGAASDARYGPWRSGLRCSLAVCAAVLVASCQQAGILDPQGPIASAQRMLLINSTEIMLVVVVPVILATLAFAWWYRSSNTRASRSDDDQAYEGRLEFVVWSIPTLVVILLGGVIWISSHLLDPRAPIPSGSTPLEIEVVSLDWKWLFIYPGQGIAAVNQLVVPTETPVRFRLTSATVMNSFFVPQLGSQIYTMPRMTTHLNLLAQLPGEFPGFSANFSGAGFADMRFIAKAVPARDFPDWVAKVRASGTALDIPAYNALAKPSIAVPPTTYRAVDPALFEAIIGEITLDPQRLHASGAWCPPLPPAGG